MKNTAIALAAIAAAALTPGPPAAKAGTLDDVKARGVLNCIVSTGLAGFSFTDKAGKWRGFDADFCRAVAAAVLGDGDKVKFIPATGKTRFTLLNSKEGDLIFRNTTWTFARDVDVKLTFTGTAYAAFAPKAAPGTSAATATQELAPVPEPAAPPARPYGPTRRMPLGLIAGARSGDKGGSANVGLWVRTDEQWAWLANTLTEDALRGLLPEAADLPITRHLLPNLRAVNFVIDDILGQGVAYQARFDPQAKGLGEWLRSRYVDIPVDLCDTPEELLP